MAVPQQKFREIVFQLLFSYDMANPHKQDMESLLMKELCVTRKTLREAQTKVDCILAQIAAIDAQIAAICISYDFSRIQRVEKNVLRLGVYELFMEEAIPQKVAISEAMRLARKFSTKEAASFVNAVLDALRKKAEGNVGCAEEELVQTFARMIESEDASRETAELSMRQTDHEVEEQEVDETAHPRQDTSQSSS